MSSFLSFFFEAWHSPHSKGTKQQKIQGVNSLIYDFLQALHIVLIKKMNPLRLHGQYRRLKTV